MKTIHAVRITDATFEQEIDRFEGLALVDFGADWCAPCRAMAPIIEELAAAYDGRVKIATVDVDANPDTAARFGIRSLPTFLFFRDGAHVDGMVGAVPRPLIERRIEALLQPQEAEAGA